MKIVNIAYRAYPEQKDALKWIADFHFFTGIWEALSERHEVTSIELIDEESTLQHKGVSYLFSRQRGLRFPVLLNQKIARLQPDVVIIHGILFPLQLILLRLVLGRKMQIIVQHHAEQPFRHPMKRALQRLADSCTDRYFFSGKGLAQRWIDQGLIANADKVTEVMEVSSVFELADQATARTVTGAAGTGVYLWVGHLNANKDPLLVVKAFTAFIEKEPGARLYLIFQSNLLLPELQQWLEQHPAAANAIILVGKVAHPALQHWYNSADFIISSSHEEGSGTAVCEAMSCACIPILTDIPSFRFMTEEGTCGLLYAKGDAAALYAALEQSRYIDKASERLKVLEQFKRKLSFKAIAATIDQVLTAHSPTGS